MEILFVSQRLHNVQISISLLPQHRSLNTHNSSVVRYQFPGAGEWACKSIAIRYQFPGATRLEQCLLPNAGCWLLVRVESQKSSEAAIVASLSSLRLLFFDRRVLVADVDAELGLLTCVWSRIGQMARLSTPERSVAHNLGMQRTQEHPGVTWF